MEMKPGPKAMLLRWAPGRSAGTTTMNLITMDLKLRSGVRQPTGVTVNSPSKAALEMIPMIRDLRDDTSAILPAALHMVETTPHYAFRMACVSTAGGNTCFLPCQKTWLWSDRPRIQSQLPSGVELSLLLQTLRICSARKMPVR